MTVKFGYGITGRVERDDDAMSPREWDNMGKMVCWHRNYNLGDEQPTCSPDKYKMPKEYIRLPLYLYDHSGITISTSPFSCPWDSGVVGFIYVEKGFEGMSDELLLKHLENEVKTYDSYLTGDCHGYIIENSQGEELAAVWGFIGEEDYCGLEMARDAEWIVNDIKEQIAIQTMEEVGDGISEMLCA